MTIPDGAFVVFCGESGSGKSTLLRQLKREIAPLGERSGTILIDGRPLAELSDRDSACRIGYVGQQPEEQIVTDRVYHELAFGLENLGLAQDTIRRRVAETACLFGIEDWFDRDTASLSGGQKQLLSLAAVMTMDPDVLLLDEPTAQLDPIAAVEFLSVVERLHREYSVTVLLVEHHLENALPCADFLACLSHGRLLAYDTVPAVLDKLRHHPDFLAGMPAAVRLFAAYPAPCPVTIRDGKAYLRALRDGGLTIVCVTHDVEFAAAIADRCAFFFRGEITSIAAPHRFFAENHLYTTAVSRITRGYYDNAVTVADTEALCTANGYREETV